MMIFHQNLRKRLALGEITKEEFEELSSILENKDSGTKEVSEEPKPQNFARLISDDE